MNSNQTFQEKPTSKTKEVVKKIGILLLIGIILFYITASVQFILS